MKYPFTRRDDECIDDYFGTQVPDPYRWLEDDLSEETSEWVEVQNRFTENYFSKIPFREKIKEKLRELYDYESFGLCLKKNDYIYFFKNNGLDNQDILYRQAGFQEAVEVFIDPNKISSSGTTTISGIGFSPDGRYISYLLSEAGSDWSTIKIIDTDTKEHLTDEIKWVKFCQPQWSVNGFYFSGYSQPEKNELSEINSRQKVLFHRLGTSQTTDMIIFEDKGNPLRYYHPHISQDLRHLVIICSEGTSGDLIFIVDLADGATDYLTGNFKSDYKYISCNNGMLLLLTNEGAPNNHIVEYDLSSKQRKEIVPEEGIVIEDAVKIGSDLIINYIKDVKNVLVKYSIASNNKETLFEPETGTVILYQPNECSVFYSVKNHLSPGTVYYVDEKNVSPIPFKSSQLNFNPENFVTEQLFFESKDGAIIPMFVSHKRHLILDGQNLVHLYGYGGFNISLTPDFSPANILLMENGGIYAVANIRGGGEYGEQWHRAGMLDKKQNVFDDFISAAEYLIEEGYTNPSKLVISGGSNGGLLVGACLVQRPDLFAAVIPRVGVLDMLRFHKFTVGWGWIVEYGCSENEDQFKFIYEYSPLHNIKENVAYPPVLVMTADHDDRVVPAHSFKFAAVLQNARIGSHPILIRIEKEAGHGAGKSRKKMIYEMSDMLSFIFDSTGMKIKNLP
ncbi:MAG: prolyl oligopeptidase family serine peptidase [Rikenellaceae bacterium]|nr:prolyl oligopeptidase family serine peptidase [Rikenellaceae bacterium]